MAFVAPLLGAVLGGITATAVGQAVLGIGLTVAANYLTRRKQPESSSAARGMSLSLRVESNEFREVILGKAASAGSLKYHNTYGPNGNDYLQLLYVLADHECDGLDGILVDGQPVTRSGNTVNEYAGHMWVSFFSGAWDQPAAAELVAENANWSSNNRGRGVCYAVVTLKFDATRFPNGIPSFLFVVRGAKLYDWRKDSTNGGLGSQRWGQPSTYEWSDNPTVCLYNWKRGIYVNDDRLAGMNAPASSLPLSEWTAAANACDELVARKDGGFEKRYRMGGVIPVDTQNSVVVTENLASKAGELVDSGGVFKPLAGVAQASVMTITDDDLMAGEPVEITPKLSRGSLINAVFGTIQDPEQAYQATALPPRISPSDEAADGGIRLEDHFNFAFVQFPTQGQRILEILRRKGRFQRQVSVPLRSRFAVLEAGDWITWKSDRYRYSGARFEVMNVGLNRDLTVLLTLREIDESIFAWSPATDELDPDNPMPVAAGGSTFSTVLGVQLSTVEIAATETVRRPGLRITWTPIDDGTVVSLELEYRKVGDTHSLARSILDLSASEYTWLDGVQGGVQYEARLRPSVQPDRAVNWTGWHQTAENTGAQVVDAAALAEAVPTDTITPEMLSAQTRFELSLATAKSEIQGSVAAQIAEAFEWAQKTGEAALQALANGHENGAQLLTERVERVNGQNALAQQITQAMTWIDDNALVVSEVIESVDGIKGRWGVSINANGVATGFATLSGEGPTTDFVVAANSFTYADPDIAGGEPQPVFIISEDPLNPGQHRAYLNGELIAEAIRAGKVSVGELSAISANAGELVSALMRDPNNIVRWEVNDEIQKIWRTDGTMTFDFGNKIVRMEF